MSNPPRGGGLGPRASRNMNSRDGLTGRQTPPLFPGSPRVSPSPNRPAVASSTPNGKPAVVSSTPPTRKTMAPPTSTPNPTVIPPASTSKSTTITPPSSSDTTPATSPAMTVLRAEICNLRKTLKHGPYSDTTYSDTKVSKYSDCAVKCFDKTFHLHRTVVSSHSPYFADIFASGDPELASFVKEIDLPEEDPRIFGMLVQLLYLGELDDDESVSKPEGPMDYVKLYVMANKYGGPGPTNLALNLASPKIHEVITKACIYNEQKNSEGYAEIINNWNIFMEIVQHVVSFLSPTDNLRSTMVRDAANKWGRLRTKKPDIQIFLSTVPKFAVEVLSRAELLVPPTKQAKTTIEVGVKNEV